MPLRSEVLVKRWSTANPPILPFLAPRVFQPWPTSTGRHRKVHSAAEAAQTEPENANQGYGSLRQIDETLGHVNLPAKWARGNSRQPMNRDGNWDTRLQDTGFGKPRTLTRIETQELVSKLGELRGLNREQRICDGHETSTSSGPRQEILCHRGKLQSWEDKRRDRALVNTRGSEDILPALVAGIRVQRAEGTLDHQLQQSEDSKAQTWRKVAQRDSTPIASKRSLLLYRSLVELDLENLRKSWHCITQEERSCLWPKLISRAYQQNPQDALKLLAATSTDPAIRYQDLSDGLDRLIRHCLMDLNGLKPAELEDSITEANVVCLTTPAKVVDVHDLKSAVMEALRQNQSKELRLCQNSIYLLLSNMADDHLELFYEELKKLNHPLKPNTLLHFASRFAKRDAKGVAISLDILKQLASKNVNFDHPRVMSLCTTILRQSVQSVNAHLTVAARFQDLLDLGLKVNVIIYNVLVYNATQIGDSETAWKIHDMMIGSNIAPDVYTYSILLNDAKWRMDFSDIQKIMDLATEKALHNRPHMVTDLLHLILLIHQNEERSRGHNEIERENEVDIHTESDYQRSTRRKEAFRKMLAKYSKHFHLDPLKKIIPDFSMRFPEVHNPLFKKLDAPPEPTLQLMLTGLLWFSDSTQTKVLYDNFIELLHRRDPTALGLASENYTWAVFLMSLGRFSDRLNDCPQLIKRMLSLKHDLEAETQTSKPRTKVKSNRFPPPRIPEPNVYTWSVLLHIFTKHKQFRAAEKIITAMQSRGTKPNEVTWTTLAWGYSRAQEVGKVADTIHRMEAGGCEVGERAKGAMFGVLDRSGLRTALAKLKLKQGEEVTERKRL